MLHGGEIYNSIGIKYDFSVNINPLGIPENVLGSLRESLFLLTQYPDQECGELRRALEKFTGIPARQILCGNGASELIETAVRGLHVRKILLTAPSFSGYSHAAESHGCEILWHELRREEKFALTDRYLEDLAQEPDLAILCSPANPVGNRIDPYLLLRIANVCERQGTWLLVDECFLGFLEDEDQRTMRRLLAPAADCIETACGTEEYSGDMPDGKMEERLDGSSVEKTDENSAEGSDGKPEKRPDEKSEERPDKSSAERPDKGLGESHGDWRISDDRRKEDTDSKEDTGCGRGTFRRLLVLDAFTKRFAMPGVRLGYLMASDPEILAAIHAQQPEWSVSIPAQVAGLAALETGGEYLEKARALVASERKRMCTALEKLGCRVFPGEANYIFFSSEKDLYEPLLQRGILIRNCDNYRGLRKGDYRAAVLRPEENEVLLGALAEILADGK